MKFIDLVVETVALGWFIAGVWVLLQHNNPTQAAAFLGIACYGKLLSMDRSARGR